MERGVFFSLLQSRRAVRSRLARSRDYLERDCKQSKGTEFPVLWSDLVVSLSSKKRGRHGVMFPKRLVVDEATLAKSATSQRDVAEC